MKLHITPEAAQDLREIGDYIREDNPQAAIQTMRRILTKTETMLLQFPEAGRLSQRIHARELVVDKNYVVLYRLKDNRVEILRILHVARKFPKK